MNECSDQADLVAMETVEEGDTHDGSADFGVLAVGSEGQRLHLHVHHAFFADVLQEGHLVVLGEPAERSVQPALACASSISQTIIMHVESEKCTRPQAI